MRGSVRPRISVGNGVLGDPIRERFHKLRHAPVIGFFSNCGVLRV